MSNIRQDVIGIVFRVCDTLRIEPEDYGRPLRDVGIDSLDLSSILLELEEKYDIRIPEEDVERLGTIDQMIEYVMAKNGVNS